MQANDADPPVMNLEISPSLNQLFLNLITQRQPRAESFCWKNDSVRWKQKRVKDQIRLQSDHLCATE